MPAACRRTSRCQLSGGAGVGACFAHPSVSQGQAGCLSPENSLLRRCLRGTHSLCVRPSRFLRRPVIRKATAAVRTAANALSDWKAEVARRREAAERQDGEGDRVLRNHLRERMLQFEGGGLMVPLDEREAQPKTRSAHTAGSSRYGSTLRTKYCWSALDHTRANSIACGSANG